MKPKKKVTKHKPVTLRVERGPTRAGYFQIWGALTLREKADEAETKFDAAMAVVGAARRFLTRWRVEGQAACARAGMAKGTRYEATRKRACEDAETVVLAARAWVRECEKEFAEAHKAMQAARETLYADMDARATEQRLQAAEISEKPAVGQKNDEHK